MSTPFDDPVGRQIMRAFPGEHPGLRAISGIAHDSGLTAQQVAGYIRAHPQFFERSALSLGGTYGFRPVFPHPESSKPRLRPFA